MVSKPYVHPSVARLRGFYARCQETMTDSEWSAFEQIDRIVNAAVALKKHCEDESLDADDNNDQLGALFDALARATKKRKRAGVKP